MLIVHILQDILNTWNPAESLLGQCDELSCPGSSFYAITAALATQGYYMQGQIVSALTYGNQTFAVFIYVCAAIAGICSMALGMPPKLYLWFFMGPALFHFLLGTNIEVKGVAWSVGNHIQDQNEVWRLAEVGLSNMRLQGTTADIDWLGSALNFLNGKFSIEFNKNVTLPWFFIYMDYLISDLVQQMTSWFGFFSQGNDFLSSSSAATGSPDYWYLLSSLKWEVMESVTSSTLSSPDLRDAFVTFLASECGDALKRSIDESRYAQAVNASGSRSGVPVSVFKNVTLNQASDYKDYVKPYLDRVSVPIPESLKSFVGNGRIIAADGTRGDMAVGSFLKFVNASVNGGGPAASEWPLSAGGGKGWEQLLFGLPERSEDAGMLKCSYYLETLVHGFRWEAGQIYNQIIKSLPKRPGTDMASSSFTGQDLGKSLFAGWIFAERKTAGTDGGVTLSKVDPPTDDTSTFYPDLLMNLIIVHLFRNEMIAAPRLANASTVTTSADKQKKYVEMNLKTVGQKSKAGEFYVWAKMVPYLQGVLLYCLAIAYPFVCILVLIPGWHKIIFTWLSFWVWVKLWDLGFAIVVLLERSVWASFGGGSDASSWWAPIIEMRGWGKVVVNTLNDPAPVTSLLSTTYDTAGSGSGDALTDSTFNAAMAIFDHALCSMSINLDLNNAYYIYIMTGLYLAVPAVIGQCVLGAKAGAASLATGIIQPVTEAGKAAASGWTGEKNAHLAANSGSVGQAAYAKALRARGKNGAPSLAMNALNTPMEAADWGLRSQEFGGRVSGFGHLAGNLGTAKGLSAANANLGGTMMRSLMMEHGIGQLFLAGKLGQWQNARDVAIESMKIGSQPGDTPGVTPTTKENPQGRISGQAATAVGGSKIPGTTQAQTAQGGLTGNTFQPGTTGIGPGLFSPYFGGLGEMAMQMADNQVQNMFALPEAQLRAKQAEAGISQFHAGAEQGRSQQAGDRYARAAAFAGASGAWSAKNDLASQASGELSAMGLNSQYLAPGAKPEGLEMASVGMLSSIGYDSAAKWGYFNNGGAFEHKINGATETLNQNFGYAPTMAAYSQNVVQPFQIWGNAFDSVSKMAEEFGYAYRAGGGNIGPGVQNVFDVVQKHGGAFDYQGAQHNLLMRQPGVNPGTPGNIPAANLSTNGQSDGPRLNLEAGTASLQVQRPAEAAKPKPATPPPVRP